MPTVGTSSKPAYVYDAGTDTWIPIGPGEHTHPYIPNTLTTTTGDIIYASGANTPARLGIGSSGDILTVSSGVPAWSAPASSGGITLIEEKVASANSSMSFTSIPGTYKQLYLVWSGIYHSGSGGEFAIRFNNSSSQYRGNAILAQGSTVVGRSVNETSVFLSGSPSQAPFGCSADLNSTDFNLAASGELVIDNYASTTKVKPFFTRWGYYNNSAVAYISANMNCTFNSTSAITSVDIVRLNGSTTFTNITNSSIRLYGVS